MQKFNFRCYAFLFCCVIALLIYIWAGDLGDDVREYYSDSDYMEWEDYTVSMDEDGACHVVGTLSLGDSSDHILAFYSVHQYVSVYADGSLIYQYPMVNNNPFSKSPGYNWNFVPLPGGVTQLEFVMTSPYADYADNIQEYIIGTPYAVLTHIASENIVAFLLCIVIFSIGVIMIIYWLFIRRKVEMEKNLLILGIFSLFLASWSINECRLTLLLFHNNIVSSYVSFLSLMLLPYTFAQFVRNFYQSRLRVWTIYSTGCILQITVCFVLQILRILDLRETLWSTHAMMLILAIIITYCSVIQLIHGYHTKRVLLNVGCLLFCEATLIMDLVAFYLGSWDSNGFGRVGYLTYIILLGIASVKESATLMKMGMKASTYHQLAYTDQMTGLLNRAAFNRDTEKLGVTPEHVAVIDFDLNNLKKTNDTYGHTAGDRYITDAAKLIEHIFGGVGNCYRIGGDEFAVLISDCTEIDIPHYLSMLEWSMDAYDRDNHMDFRMQIAYGYAIYELDDVSLETTYNRADKCMYNDKKMKKGSP